MAPDDRSGISRSGFLRGIAALTVLPIAPLLASASAQTAKTEQGESKNGILTLPLAKSLVLADDLPRARPEELGFSPERLSYIDAFYGDMVKKGEMAGVVTLVARHGRIAHFSAVGYADVER